MRTASTTQSLCSRMSIYKRKVPRWLTSSSKNSSDSEMRNPIFFKNMYLNMCAYITLQYGHIYNHLPMIQYINVDGESDNETAEDDHQHSEPVIVF